MCERAKVRHDSDCAAHTAQGLMESACTCGAIVTAALEHAMLALSATHNCLTTDRPDLPRAPDTCWTTDFSEQIALIEAALTTLGFSSCSDPRSGVCRTSPSNSLE